MLGLVVYNHKATGLVPGLFYCRENQKNWVPLMMPWWLTLLPLGPLKPMGPRDPDGPYKNKRPLIMQTFISFQDYCQADWLLSLSLLLSVLYLFVLSVQTTSTEDYTEVSDSWRTLQWCNDSRWCLCIAISLLLTSKLSEVSAVDLLDCLVVLVGRSLLGFLGAPVSDGKHVKHIIKCITKY